MSFNVTFSFNNGAGGGTATSILVLRNSIYEFGLTNLTQCTLSGTAEGQLTTGNSQGTTTGTSYGLFQNCSALTNLNLSNLDTSNVTNMYNMFYNCSSLTNLDLSNLDTSNVIDMTSMFYSCSSLTNLNLSNLDTSNVNSMSYMFRNCSALRTLDLSNFNMSGVTNTMYMFYDCSNLEHIYVGYNWDTSAVGVDNSMFTNCTKLPNFNSSYTDITNAHTGTGGYLEFAPPTQIGIYHKYGSNVFKLKFSNEYVAPEYIEPEPEPEPPEPPSEWNLTFDGGSNTYTADVSASSDRDFGPALTWVEGKVYRIVFDCKVTAKSSTGVSISIRNQAQTYTFFTSTTLQVGDTKHVDDSYTETRSRSRSTFVARRAGTGNSYSVEVSNVKVYEHI